MKIIVVGGGGREHALIQALKKNPQVTQIFALPGNGGIAQDATCVEIAATDREAIVEFAQRQKIQYAVVAPDDPLVLGLVDDLEEKGIPCFGPRKNAAILEGSKAFAKELMKKYGIPTAEYEVFDDMDKALAYIDRRPAPMVVKADGLALGKGVLICHTREQARQAVRSMMEQGAFGASGRRVVVEEFLEGPEISVLSFTDGETVVPMVSSMDHKRALEGDQGLNTGGMGTIAPNPFYTPEVARRCMEEIFLPTIRAMAQEGRPFKGCLYFGLMLTADGPKVIEYNCRFGDPETQVVLPLMETDLFTVMRAVTEGRLKETPVRFAKDRAACCVMIASKGYPEKYEKGFPISLPVPGEGEYIYVSGAKRQGETLVSSGGRVLGMTATAPTLRQAVEKAYALAEKVSFENGYYRRDIGQRALKVEK